MGGPIIDKSLFRCQFSVLSVQPLNLFESCQLYCSKCKTNVSFKTLEMQGAASALCKKCNEINLEPIFCIQMLAQDMSLLHLDSYKRQDRISDEFKRGNEFVRVLLYTNNGLCNKFFNGIPPTNLYRENTTRMMVERYIR